VLSLAIHRDHGHPHLPQRQVCGINVFEHAVLALFLDEVPQPDYVHTPIWLDSEQYRFTLNEAYKSTRSVVGHRGLLWFRRVDRGKCLNNGRTGASPFLDGTSSTLQLQLCAGSKLSLGLSPMCTLALPPIERTNNQPRMQFSDHWHRREARARDNHRTVKSILILAANIKVSSTVVITRVRVDRSYPFLNLVRDHYVAYPLLSNGVWNFCVK
jgi:hypothetical protein